MARWAILAAVLAATLPLTTPAAASDCPACAPYEQWMERNGEACGYHGARPPSICEGDANCVQWNKNCRQVEGDLKACMADCKRQAEAPPPPYRPSQPDRVVAGASGPSCAGARLALDARDPERFESGRIAIVAAVSGEATLMDCETGASPVSEGTVVRLGDCIRTEARSKIRIRFLDGEDVPAAFYVGPRAEACFESFEPYQADGDHWRAGVNLVQGVARATARGWGGQYGMTIRASATVNGVRSGDIAMVNEKDGDSGVAVGDGSAYFFNPTTGEGVNMSAGMVVEASDGVFAKPEPMTNENWAELIDDEGLNLTAPTEIVKLPSPEDEPVNPAGMDVLDPRTAVYTPDVPARLTAVETQLKTDRDHVSRGEAVRGDGHPDAAFIAEAHAPGKTITKIAINNVGGQFSVWDTQPRNGHWLAAIEVGGRKVTLSDGSVSFPLGPAPVRIVAYCQNNRAIGDGRTAFRMTVSFADGTEVTADYPK